MSPVQFALATIEFLLLGSGAFLIGRVVTAPAVREEWFRSSRLPLWPVDTLDFVLFVFVTLTVTMFAQGGISSLMKPYLITVPDNRGFSIVVNGLASDGSALLCWWAFWRWLRIRRGEPAEPVAMPGGYRVSQAGRAAWSALLGFVAVYPVLSLASAGWSALLHLLGLPEERQDIIEIFAQTRSPFVLAGLGVLAVVVAPLAEEFVFRAGLYRFLRGRLPRWGALLGSAVLFAGLHANLPSCVPLGVLGVALALVYEKTGSLVAPVVLHGLFNLNTTLIVLSGLPDLSP